MKLTNKQLKQIIKEELSYVLNEMGGELDALKDQMDQREYDIVSNNIRLDNAYLARFIMGLEESYRPNRMYAKAGFPGVYWTKITQAFAYEGYELKQEDLQNAKQAVLEDPSFFTPTGLGRAIAILEYLESQG